MGIGFIGAGKVGKALGLYFKSHGLLISGYYSKTQQSASDAAKLTGSNEFTTIKELAATSRAIFLTVPDQALTDIDREIAALLREHAVAPEKVWIHVSGAHPANCLEEIKATGGAVGSMHPLQSFGDPESSASRLEKVWFTLEGTDKAVLTIKAILNETGGQYSLIDAESKPLYHAGACVVSNFLVTLLESGIRFFETSGMDRKDIFPAIMPLIDATLSNICEKGTIDALTGPIVRADFDTVSAHLTAMAAQLPEESDFYKSMANKTIKMLDGKRLMREQAECLQCILEGTDHVK